MRDTGIAGVGVDDARTRLDRVNTCRHFEHASLREVRYPGKNGSASTMHSSSVTDKHDGLQPRRWGFKSLLVCQERNAQRVKGHPSDGLGGATAPYKSESRPRRNKGLTPGIRDPVYERNISACRACVVPTPPMLK